MINLKDSRARRKVDLDLMMAYSSVSKRFADTGMNEQALACQWKSDLHRISAALWHKASSDSDPHGAYFRYLASSFAAASAYDGEGVTSAYDSLLRHREAYHVATRALNIPLAIPSAGHLRAIGHVDLVGAGMALTGGRSADEFFEQQILPAESRNAAVNAQVAILTYLIDFCDNVGDTSRVTALAAWSLLRHKGVEAHRLEEVLSVAEKHLGPVDWIRLGPYLERARVRQA